MADYFIGVCAGRKRHLSAMGGQPVHSGILPPSLAIFDTGACCLHHGKSVTGDGTKRKR
jgi:hypothetical protein